MCYPTKSNFVKKKKRGKGKGLQLPVLWIIGAVSSAAPRHSSDWVWKLNGFQVSLTQHHEVSSSGYTGRHWCAEFGSHPFLQSWIFAYDR